TRRLSVVPLQLYNFGETVSVVFWTDSWRPESFYDKIARNREMGFHTLCLLDIKVKEQSVENMMRGRRVFEPPRFMTVSQAAEQLLEIVHNRRERGDPRVSPLAPPALSEATVCVGLARVGSETQRIAAAPLSELAGAELGGPLHSLVVTGQLHPLEADMLRPRSAPGRSTDSERSTPP
uniref:Diphthamide biosynthesis 5 n=1 Tax=Petromyzon marinus TaxID=7757 RepID=S4RUU7_PETMA